MRVHARMHGPHPAYRYSAVSEQDLSLPMHPLLVPSYYCMKFQQQQQQQTQIVVVMVVRLQLRLGCDGVGDGSSSSSSSSNSSSNSSSGMQRKISH
jgi:hypothetical protein